jgi:hypothetical protein
VPEPQKAPGHWRTQRKEWRVKRGTLEIWQVPCENPWPSGGSVLKFDWCYLRATTVTILPALGRLGERDYEFKTKMGYLESHI